MKIHDIRFFTVGEYQLQNMIRNAKFYSDGLRKS
jgi:hypothetical protein